MTNQGLAKYLIPIWLILLLAACGGSGNSDFSVSEPVFASYKEEELNFIDKELNARHPDLYFSKSIIQYENDLATLKRNSPQLSDLEFRFETAKFIASLGDQHTYITLPVYDLLQFPIRFWWVENRAIITETTTEFQELLGYEIVDIDGIPVAELADIGMQYLSYENPYWKLALSPSFINLPELLHHEGMTASPNRATFSLIDTQQNRLSRTIDGQIGINQWQEIETTHSPTPLYMRNQENYSLATEGELLYIQYRSAFSISGYSLSAFINDIQRAIENNSVEKIVVDLRFNYGGLIDHFIPVIDYLASTTFNHSDKLFVLSGRHTFSSAVGALYSFQNLTNATFAGGPSGGKPNGFSNVIGYRMISSNTLFMSTSYLQVASEDSDAFYPQHLTPFTQQDFLTGNDPALAFIESVEKTQ